MQCAHTKMVELPGESAMADVSYQWCQTCGTLKMTSADGVVRFLSPGGATHPGILAFSDAAELNVHGF